MAENNNNKIEREIVGKVFGWTKDDLTDPVGCVKDSYAKMRDNLNDLIGSQFPLRMGDPAEYVVEFSGLRMNDSTFTEEECRDRDYSLTYSVTGSFRLFKINEDGTRTLHEMNDSLKLFNLPKMTDRGTFIIRGSERAIAAEEVNGGRQICLVGDFIKDSISKGFDSMIKEFSESLAEKRRTKESLLSSLSCFRGETFSTPIDEKLRELFSNTKREPDIDNEEEVEEASTRSRLISPTANLLSVYATVNTVLTPLADEDEISPFANQNKPRFTDYAYASYVKEGGTYSRAQLGLGVKIDDEGYPMIPVYKVNNGVVADDWQYVRLEDLFGSHIIGPDSVDPETREIILEDDRVVGTLNGVDPAWLFLKDVEWVMANSFQTTAVANSLNVMGSHDQYARNSIAANQNSQALHLLNPEVPLVSTGLAEKFSNCLRTEKGGTVSVEPLSIRIVGYDGTEEKHIIPKGYELRVSDTNKIKKGTVLASGEDGEIVATFDGKVTVSNPVITLVSENGNEVLNLPENYTLRVKDGDELSPQDLIADSPETRNGELCNCVNLLSAICVMGNGSTESDSVVLSRAALEKLTTKETKTIEVYLKRTPAGQTWLTSDIPHTDKETRDMLSKLENGLPKVGTILKEEDYVVGIAEPDSKSLRTPSQIAIMKGAEADYSDKSVVFDSEGTGKVKSVKVFDRTPDSAWPKEAYQKVVIKLDVERPARPGDKITGGNGDKFTISRFVVENDQRQKVLNGPLAGTDIDIYFPPTSSPSRELAGAYLARSLALLAFFKKTHYEIPANSKDAEFLIRKLLAQEDMAEDSMYLIGDAKTSRLASVFNTPVSMNSHTSENAEKLVTRGKTNNFGVIFNGLHVGRQEIVSALANLISGYAVEDKIDKENRTKIVNAVNSTLGYKYISGEKTNKKNNGKTKEM